MSALDATPRRGTVAVVGFGYIGTVIGAVLADRGYRVIGVDPDPRVADAVRAGRSHVPEPGLAELLAAGVANGRLTVTDDPAAVSACETVLIAVGTPLSAAGDADIAQLVSAAASVAPHLRDDQLVVLKSTTPPGMHRR